MQQWAGAQAWKKSACSLNTLAATSPPRWSCLCLWKEMKQNHISSDCAAGCSLHWTRWCSLHHLHAAHVEIELAWMRGIEQLFQLHCYSLCYQLASLIKDSAVSAVIPDLPGPQVSMLSKRCQWREDRQPVKMYEGDDGKPPPTRWPLVFRERQPPATGGLANNWEIIDG